MIPSADVTNIKPLRNVKRHNITEIMFHLTEEVILAEERTTEEEKQHIIEGKNYVTVYWH